MNTSGSSLAALLRVAAVFQIAMVALKLCLVQFLRLTPGVTTRWPTDVRELFVVHVLCVSLVVLTISVLTLRFAREIANQTHGICRWLAGAAAIFWMFRGWLQLVYGLDSEWPVNQLHWFSMAVNGGLASVYALAACRQGR